MIIGEIISINGDGHKFLILSILDFLKIKMSIINEEIKIIAPQT